MQQIKIVFDGSLNHLPLTVLHLDHTNPRFGGAHLTANDEKKVVDEIIGQHGIIDVISSIAANGYFDSEPLVGAVNKGHNGDVTIVEGNRRLTAALVLAGDARASAHEKLRKIYPNSQIRKNTKLPVLVYDWTNRSHQKALLPYLGVRHIVGAQQWDSYAKAAWVADIVENHGYALDDIKRMIGDEQNFTDRLIEGYYFLKQVFATNTYDPADSLRRGRGSMYQLPFSWIYTALGYRSVRSFLRLPSEAVLHKNPIKDDHLEFAGLLLQFMFGGRGKNAAIDDSRYIGSLAKALQAEPAVAVLSKGGTIDEALDAARPPNVLLTELLSRADKSLTDAVKVASGLPQTDRVTYQQIEDALEKVTSRLDSLISVIEQIRPRPQRASKRRGS